jgi:hypothetical protein
MTNSDHIQTCTVPLLDNSFSWWYIKGIPYAVSALFIGHGTTNTTAIQKCPTKFSRLQSSKSTSEERWHHIILSVPVFSSSSYQEMFFFTEQHVFSLLSWFLPETKHNKRPGAQLTGDETGYVHRAKSLHQNILTRPYGYKMCTPSWRTDGQTDATILLAQLIWAELKKSFTNPRLRYNKTLCHCTIHHDVISWL